VAFELIRQIYIWERSTQHNPLYWLNYSHETAHTISLISPSKSSSSSNTSHSDTTSSILNERETRFASGIERGRSDPSRSFWTPRNFRTSTRKFWLNGLRPLFPKGYDWEKVSLYKTVQYWGKPTHRTDFLRFLFAMQHFHGRNKTSLSLVWIKWVTDLILSSKFKIWNKTAFIHIFPSFAHALTLFVHKYVSHRRIGEILIMTSCQPVCRIRR